MTITLKQITLTAFMFLCLHVPHASALAVVTRFIGGAAPANAVGGGNLDEIVNAAARIWESAYGDPFVVTLYYGWAEVGDAGIHTLQQCDDLDREISGVILFDNSGSVPFYLDPTPDANEEYRRKTEEYQDLGKGFINVARILVSPAGDAAGHVDLLSVALHEIGHALGLSAANARFLNQSAGGVIYISEDCPFAGTLIPLAYNNSGIVPHFDTDEIVYGALMSGVNADERRMPSELDILANAQISGFTIAFYSRTSSGAGAGSRSGFAPGAASSSLLRPAGSRRVP